MVIKIRTAKDLQMLQSLDLETKILKTKQRIREWYYYFGGQVYVAFSGGKDSTVLLDLVRQEFPEVPAVFVNTGLEYPEIVEFVRTIDNVIELKPKMNFTEVIKKYGYPVISKEQSQYIQQYKNAKSDKTKNTRWNGDSKGRFKISEKWKPLATQDKFDVSEKCCDIMKKLPSKEYEKETGRFPIIGTMADESMFRKTVWLKYNCNAFENKKPTSKPISFWLKNDIWEYIHKYNIPYSKIYDMGYDRTGCVFCGFSIHLEKQPNKFQLMEKTHPKLHKYCIEKLKLGDIVDFMNKNCKCNINLYNNV